MILFSWLPLAVFSYLLASINGTVDRALVHKDHTKPIIVSFWVALFSIATVGLSLIGFLPFSFAGNFKFVFGSLDIMSLALLSGFFTQLALLFMYRALKYGEVTRVLSVMGGLIPIVSFVAAYIFLGERLGHFAIVGFIVLIISTIVLTLNPRRMRHLSFSKWVINIVLASLVFGSQAVLAKHIYDNYHFVSAYSVSGLGAGLYVLFIALLSSNVRRELSGIINKNSKNKSRTKSKHIYLIIGNSLLGGFSVILTNVAISMGSPTLVGALRGVEYAGIFIIAVILSKIYPKILGEDLSRKSVLLKVSGIMLTITGIILLAVSA
jgi:drug/metabolite transporter (DMT)-like permease